MVRLSPAEAAEKYNRNMKNATADIRRGINRVTQAPGVKAAQKADKMLNNLTEAVTSGRWGRNVSKVTLEEWKDKTERVGIPRIAAGVDAAMPKMQSTYAELFDFMDRVLAEVNKLPDTTLEERIQKSVAYQYGMAKYNQRGR